MYVRHIPRAYRKEVLVLFRAAHVGEIALGCALYYQCRQYHLVSIAHIGEITQGCALEGHNECIYWISAQTGSPSSHRDGEMAHLCDKKASLK